jgi:2-keto-4-pentenoate hydratase/2-oxohepta-3-ene-1,7-dioic acid hydratase in catechol pathway
MKVATPEYPEVFLKPANTVTTATDPIIIPKTCHDQVDGEVELAVIIGKDCKDLTLQNAMEHVLGYTVANDVTARKFQARGSQWGFSKGFDTFCPLGPVVVSRQSLPDPKVLELKTILNGRVMQDGKARNMIFSIEDILVYLSSVSSFQQYVEVTATNITIAGAHFEEGYSDFDRYTQWHRSEL